MSSFLSAPLSKWSQGPDESGGNNINTDRLMDTTGVRSKYGAPNCKPKSKFNPEKVFGKKGRR